MSARVGLAPDEYKKLMTGTHFLTLEDSIKHYEKGTDLTSIYHSSKVVDEFQLQNAVYKKAMKYEDYLDSSVVAEALKAKK
jgi:NitT/TauT family transport system substrate-binding protein